MMGNVGTQWQPEAARCSDGIDPTADNLDKDFTDLPFIELLAQSISLLPGFARYKYLALTGVLVADKPISRSRHNNLVWACARGNNKSRHAKV